jgi:hypothetical protein
VRVPEDVRAARLTNAAAAKRSQDLGVWMALTGIVARRTSSILVGLAVLLCAPAAVRTEPRVEAILTRGGGLSGIAETIRNSSTSGEPAATRQLSNDGRPRTIRLPRKTLDSSLVVIESLVDAPPYIPADSGLLRPLCGDAILTRIEVTRGGRVRSAQEECPHRTPASESYWQRVDSLFRLLASAAP